MPSDSKLPPVQTRRCGALVGRDVVGGEYL
jgi:hypothetical protein